jgi:hypothetical protein
MADCLALRGNYFDIKIKALTFVYLIRQCPAQGWVQAIVRLEFLFGTGGPNERS